MCSSRDRLAQLDHVFAAGCLRISSQRHAVPERHGTHGCLLLSDRPGAWVPAQSARGTGSLQCMANSVQFLYGSSASLMLNSPLGTQTPLAAFAGGTGSLS